MSNDGEINVLKNDEVKELPSSKVEEQNPIKETPKQEQKMDYLQQRIIEKESKIKSSTLAAVLGFFFPFIGFLYVKRYIASGVAVLIWILGVVMTTIGIGFAILLLYAIICSYMCYKSAENMNTQSLKLALESSS